MSTVTLIVLSDPSAGEESLGRVFNALAAAHDFEQRGQPVQLVFQGTGTRWPALLNQADHPAHALYSAVQHRVAGASLGCATVFGAKDDVAAADVRFLTDNAVPGTPGLSSIAEYAARGPVITF
jgi:hypothetical protein